MRTVFLLSLLLVTIVSSGLGYPPVYYVYLVHEVLLVLIGLWVVVFVVKKVRKPLEVVTLFFIFFFVVLSPVNALLAPDYETHFEGDVLAHVEYLVHDVGERPYLSDNEKEAAEYIQKILKEKGFSPVVDGNVMIIVEGKKEAAVIFCAHYDTVPGSPGADDNGSGVSVLLELEIPEQPEYTIIIIFFTGEECGLVESRYVAQTIERDIVGVICVDTVGVGKDLHISSLRKNRSKSFFLSQLVYGLSDTGIPSIGPLYSDHVPFNQEGVKAVALTRSTNREYPHIHSEKDVTVFEDYLVETGETVQKVLYHFSRSETPYLFVNAAVILTVFISGGLAVAIQQLMDKKMKS